MINTIPVSVERRLKFIKNSLEGGTFVAPWYIIGSEGWTEELPYKRSVILNHSENPIRYIKQFSTKQQVWNQALKEAASYLDRKTYSNSEYSTVGKRAISYISNPDWWYGV